MNPFEDKNDYEVLGLTPRASRKDVQSAYARHQSEPHARKARDTLAAPGKRVAVDVFIPSFTLSDAATDEPAPSETEQSDWLRFVDRHAVLMEAAQAFTQAVIESLLKSRQTAGHQTVQAPVWKYKTGTFQAGGVLLKRVPLSPAEMPPQPQSPARRRRLVRTLSSAAIIVLLALAAYFALSYLQETGKATTAHPLTGDNEGDARTLEAFAPMDAISSIGASLLMSTTTLPGALVAFTTTVTPSETPVPTDTATATATQTPVLTSTPTVIHSSTTIYIYVSTATKTFTPQPSNTPGLAPSPTSSPTPVPFQLSALSNVNARACPRLDCEVVGKLVPGERIGVIRMVEGDIVAGSERWCQITLDGEEAFIHSSLASPIDPSP